VTLDTTWDKTTKRINGGENAAFHIKEMKTGEQDWSLSYDSLDADGQKLPTSESTIQSRYSKKHLGKSPGLSIYTLIANFVAANAKNNNQPLVGRTARLL
jgi:hypothetical protein